MASSRFVWGLKGTGGEGLSLQDFRVWVQRLGFKKAWDVGFAGLGLLSSGLGSGASEPCTWPNLFPFYHLLFCRVYGDSHPTEARSHEFVVNG